MNSSSMLTGNVPTGSKAQRVGGIATVALIAVMPCSPAPAQDASSQLATIVVTAQKRSENVQDVPIAITALTADMLQDRGALRGEDLQQTVPGLIFSDSPTGVGLITIRGVGGDATRGSTPGRSPAVSINLDGVYLPSPSFMMQDFLDLDRVEVLRGPQGTLWGSNAIGGSINFVTKQPTADFESEATLDVGNYETHRLTAVVSGPLSDTLRARLAVAAQDQNGYVTDIDLPNNRNFMAAKYYNIRAALQYDPTSDIQVDVTGYLYNRHGASYVFRPTSLPPVNLALPSLYNVVPPGYQPITFFNDREVQQDIPANGYDKTEGGIAHISWNLGGPTLRSISGYFDSMTGSIYDGSGIDLVHDLDELFQGYRTFSEELQLASSQGGPLTWLFGNYYYHENSYYALESVAPDAYVPFDVNYLTPSTVLSRSIAQFAQANYNILPDLTITAGARYTHDEMTVSRSGDFEAGGVTFFDYSHVPDSASWSKPTWKLGVDYHLSPDAMAYASYSRGYTSGGFNIQDTNPSFKPETLDAYEVGMKSEWLDRTLTLNGSAFYYKYKDKQETTVDSVGFTIIENAGKATLFGSELELVTRPLQGLRVDASVAWLHAYYNQFSTVDPENAELGVENLEGKWLTDAPEWEAHIGPQYSTGLGSNRGMLTMRVDYSFIDSRFVRPFNLATDKLPSYGRTNALVSWESANEDWNVEFHIENIENKDVINSFTDTSPFNGFVHTNVYLPPRTFGVRLTHRF
jgi:iron complex outermembrane recepter protein